MDELDAVHAQLQAQHGHAFKIRILLDDIRSMQNVGSVFRTADAFAIDAIYLCGYTPIPPHRDIHKTALGATETVQWHHKTSIEEAIIECKKDGYQIVSIEQVKNSITLAEIPKDKAIALIFGNEVNGVSEEALALSDMAVEIPQYGTKHSLNISVTTAVVVWELIRVPHL